MSDPWSFGWAQIIALVNTSAVFLGVGIAAWGLRKWRIEQIGKRQCELAEEALALSYEAQGVFDFIRSPIGFAGEGSTRKRSEGETEAEQKVLDQEFVSIERINNQADFFSRVQKLRPRFKALFGTEATEPLDEILKVRGDVILAARMLSHYAVDNIHASREERADSRANREKQQDVKWKGSSTPDLIDQRLSIARQKLETRISPLLKSRYRG
jgi:hypothetical protein